MIKKIMATLATAAVAIGLVVAGPAAPAQASTTYYYAGGYQGFAGTLPNSLFASFTSPNPTLDSTGPNYESHTLAEIAITQGSGANRQAGEIGLRKDSGDAGLKVFVYAWVNNTPCGYSLIDMCGTTIDFVHCDTVGGVNNCGQATDNWDVDQQITTGVSMRLGIEYFSSNWWFTAYTVSGQPLERLGYIPGTLWSNAGVTFTTGDTIYAYGEVAPGAGSLGCTDMGNGVLAVAGPPRTGAVIGSVSAPPIANSAIDIDAGLSITDATKYNVYIPAPGPNVRTLDYGGPGAC